MRVRALPAFRWLLALSLALGAIWHPVLTAVGEMHEADDVPRGR